MTSEMTVQINPQMIAKLRRSLILHEGYHKFPYIDSVGKITIGIGYNLDDRGIDDDWINNRFNADWSYFYSQLNQFPWFKDLNFDRQIVLIDMCFMGWKRFLGFEKMIQCLSIHDYKGAADEMLDSEWANQVKGRATALANAMNSGVYDI